MGEIISVTHNSEIIAAGGVDPGILPDDFISSSIEAIKADAQVVMLELGYRPNNRDLDLVGRKIASVVTSGEDLISRLDWLSGYYQNELKQVASEVMGEEAIPLASINEGVMGLAFGPDMRLEAHVDVWALNANLFLKTSDSLDNDLRGGTVIGQPEAKTHQEILDNRLATIYAEAGKLTIVACRDLPHTVGIAGVEANFNIPSIELGSFWSDPSTRISFNFSYTTERQLSEQPDLVPMNAAVGNSQPVLGIVS